MTSAGPGPLGAAQPVAPVSAVSTATPTVSSASDIDAALSTLVAARPPLLVIIDFDGTLAVGSRDPAVARIEPLAQRALRRLGGLSTARPERLQLAVLTGRVVADVAARVRVGGVEYLGDHGLESGRLARGGRAERLVVSTDPAFDVHRDTAEALASGVAAELGGPGWLFVERKGPSVAFHVRQADDVPTARAAVVRAIDTVERRLGLVHGLAHYRGRSVVDLRPRDAGGKREAVDRLVARHRPGAIAALGDEMSDIDAFEAVIAARRAAALVGVTIAVHGLGRPAPTELLAVADLRLAGARDVGRWLAALARRLERSA
jgi:trehalose-phosphatase